MVATSYFGRKALMVATNSLIVATLVLMWFFMKTQLQAPALVATAFFLLLFELGSGQIYWPYAAEICTDKGTSAAAVHVWCWCLIVGLLVPYMMSDWLQHGLTFLVFAALSFAVSCSTNCEYRYFRERFTSGAT